MKITRKEIRRLIREELELLNESRQEVLSYYPPNASGHRYEIIVQKDRKNPPHVDDIFLYVNDKKTKEWKLTTMGMDRTTREGIRDEVASHYNINREKVSGLRV